MLLLYGCILVLSLWGIRRRPTISRAAALSVEQTNMVKGIFVLLVFVSHISQYLDMSESTGFLTHGYTFLQSKIGQMVVVPFLFYSGFGIRYSIEKKGTDYLRTLPKRRILRTYIHAVFILVLFLLLQLALGKRYSLAQLFAGFLFWGSFGNSNWYLFAILLLYLFTWFSFTVFQDKNVALLSCLLLTLAYCYILSHLVQHWWYDTVLAYWFGLVYLDIQALFDRLLRNRFPVNTRVWSVAVLCVSSVLLLLTWRSFGLPTGVCGNLRAVFLMLLINLLLERFVISNQVLNWLGEHVFEFYLLQRLPMILLDHFNIQQFSIALYIAGTIVATTLLVVPINYAIKRIDLLLFS